MARRPPSHVRGLGVMLGGLGAVVLVLATLTGVDARLLATVSATALLVAGVYLNLPAAAFAEARYRFQPKFQAASGIAGLLVAAAFDYIVVGSIDWVLAFGVAIGVFIGSGFFRSGTRD